MTELVSTCKTKDDFVKLLDKKISDLDKGEFIDGFGGDCGQKAIKKYSMQLDGAIAYIVKKKSWTLGLKTKIKRYMELRLTKKKLLSGYSGLVFAGFGEEEALPHLEEYYVDIVVGDKVRYWLRRKITIDEKRPSEVVPFADAEAMTTLIDGISPSFRREAFNAARKVLYQLPVSIISSITELTVDQKKKYLAAAQKTLPGVYKAFIDNMTSFRNKTYARPIRQSIASLPMSELGTVAEAFLGASQVLKKVNPDLETIGGPVDIAVISKGDGFVWIKRKYYFSDQLNPGFRLRYLES